MPEAKPKHRKQAYESQAASHLDGLRILPDRAERDAGSNANPDGEKPRLSASQPALVSKLIDFIKTM